MVCLFVWFLILVPSFSDARSIFKQPEWYNHKEQKVDKPTLDDYELTGTIAWWTSYETNKLEWILKFPEREQYSSTLWYALSLIQISINWILWILATVALIYMLYCWFLVFSSWADDKNAQKGRKWISTAAIALAWIGLSRLIISLMLRFINILTNV